MTEWKDISTAPKDGSLFLACNAGAHPEDYPSEIYIAFWCDGAYGDNEPRFYDWSGGLDSYHFNGHEEWGFWPDTTHWMHLPPPPQASGE